MRIRTYCQAIIRKQITHIHIPCGRYGALYVVEGDLADTKVVLCWNCARRKQMKRYKLHKVINGKNSPRRLDSETETVGI